MEPLSSCPAAFLASLLLLLLLSEARGDCNPPQRTIGTQIRGESQPSYPVGTRLSYTCKPGYEPIPGTRPVIECLANSQWNKIPEFCRGKRCPVPNIENGRIVEDSELRLGDEITFACDEGHRILGRNRARCILRSGSVDWDSAPLHCERIPCYPPPTILNGRHNGRDNYVYGTAVTYQCDDPFSLIGEKTLVCLSDEDQNGQWSSPAPRCEAVNCRLPTVENGVMVTSIQPSYKYEDRIVFTCKEGYHLKGNKGDITCREDSTWGPRLPECILGSSGGDIGTGTTADGTLLPTSGSSFSPLSGTQAPPVTSPTYTSSLPTFQTELAWKKLFIILQEIKDTVNIKTKSLEERLNELEKKVDKVISKVQSSCQQAKEERLEEEEEEEEEEYFPVRKTHRIE